MVVKMKKKMEEHYLFDFYGELLTEKQKQILDYYYNDDYSLAEIAEVMAVTRQGIFDVIKRSRLMMESYENKLGLMNKFLKTQRIIKQAQKELNALAINIEDQKIENKILAIRDQLDGVNAEN